jgi:drug/metabolite transporter (DMT)-like permease
VTPYHLIPVAAVLMCCGSWLSYGACRQKPWQPFLTGAVACLSGILWGWAAKLADGPRGVFAASCVWDALAIGCWSVLPLVLWGVRLSPVGWAGFALVVIGAFLVKWGG